MRRAALGEAALLLIRLHLSISVAKTTGRGAAEEKWHIPNNTSHGFPRVAGCMALAATMSALRPRHQNRLIRVLQEHQAGAVIPAF